jgi:methionyl-tRNA formyltransferase
VKIDWIFFGTDEFAVGVLAELKARGLTPRLIITAPDRPAGRGLKLTPPPVKVWAEENNLPYQTDWPNQASDLFVVASYGQILKADVLALARHGTLNVHPSLLPHYRGAAPIQSAILNGDEETAVSIMLLDEEMDHGPLLKTQKLNIKEQNYLELRDELAKLGGELLAELMPKWLAGEVKARPQDHALATYTKKIKKEDGEIKLTDDPKLNWRKFRAYQPWPGTYFFENGQRLKITAAEFTGGRFVIKKVIPEGGREINY